MLTHWGTPAEWAARIPELDTILPFKCRAEKTKKSSDPEFLSAVPEQYRQGIRDQIAAAGRGTTGSGCAIQPAKRPKVAPTKDELFDDDEDKKHIKVEDDRVVGEGAERAEPAAPSVVGTSFASLSKGDVGPRAVLGTWRTDATEASVVPPAKPTDVVSMEAKLKAAHGKHLAGEKVRRRPAAALRRPAAAAAPMVAAVQAHRLRRRLKGKQPRPGAWAGTIDADLIKEKLESCPNVDSFTSWGYHRVRNAMVKAGHSDTNAKAMGSQWYGKLKAMWTERYT